MVRLLGTIVLLFWGLNTSAQSQVLSNSRWAFSSITNLQGDTVKPCESSDSLFFLDDQHFSYFIQGLKLEAKGNYEWSSDSLVFHYQIPSDTSRTYGIKISPNQLVLYEGDVRYAFQSNVAMKNLDSGSIWRYFWGILLVIILILVRKKKANT